MIGLRNCGHLGRLGDWAEMAAEAGQVSLHFLNTSGAQRVAPFGGSDRRLSTNPLAIGVPLAGGRSGDPRHHDVDGRRGQADGRAEQGRAGARRLDRRQGRQADDGPEGLLRRRRAAHDRRAQGVGTVDAHGPARGRDHDRTQLGSRRHRPAQQHAVDLHRAGGLRRQRRRARRGEALRRLREGLAAVDAGAAGTGPGGRRAAHARRRGARTACRSTTRRGTT